MNRPYNRQRRSGFGFDSYGFGIGGPFLGGFVGSLLGNAIFPGYSYPYGGYYYPYSYPFYGYPPYGYQPYGYYGRY